MLGLQGIEVIHTNENSGIFCVFVKPVLSYAAYPKCGKITENMHDVRVQCYDHLPIWGRATLLVLPVIMAGYSIQSYRLYMSYIRL